ncbi:hypothetical protein PR202_gb19942 [Eleusine coracana subsp. coracana]|uniref:Uncharacterized protein n=1 Tax=Eleusine coracana subsp. coracana TaxID=191504 RepID=A0AAV5FBB3_ELECO|nr:hypothetical protein PR202_gb19942 [Eleusine coracana subsp. coracana]
MEKLPAAASFLGAVLSTALFLIIILRHRRQRKYNLPPGPRPRPVIGNLNLIGPLPHRSVHELSAKYGPLMSLRFGSVPVVVGLSVEMAKFFLKTHDLAFIDRPRLASGRYTGFNFSDVLWSPYGPYWRQARKLWKAEVFSAAARIVRTRARRARPRHGSRRERRRWWLGRRIKKFGKAQGPPHYGEPQRDLAHGAGQQEVCG